MTPRQALAVLAALAPWAAAACPADNTPRAATTVLTVQVPGQPDRAYDAAALAALPPTTLTQTLSVSNGRDGAQDRRVAYGGVLLKDALVAATGLFNSPAGAQTVIVATLDGQPLGTAAGPLALRALGDLRPGPRHVRNLCALVVRPLPR